MPELVQQVVQWLLIGGGLLGLLQFIRDRRKASHEADNVNVTGSHTAVEVLQEALTEVKVLLEEERAESKQLRETLRAERKQHSSDLQERDKDVRMLTLRLAEAITLTEVTKAQLEAVQAELDRIRAKYNITDTED